MRTDDHRRSTNYEDRGIGSRGAGAGGLAGIFMLVFRMFGWKGALALVVVGAAVYFLAPSGLRQAVFGGGGGGAAAGGAVCEASQQNAAACDFSRVVLASTEDVWTQHFAAGRLPAYRGAAPRQYSMPSLVVFGNAVATGGCGNATSDVGPFYCPADRKLYIDPEFYTVMERQLRAPGDFAQAYVIAHEVGHHVQNLIGATQMRVRGETDAQVSVRMELQADCFAGVWGHTARASLSIDDEDLSEAVNAAHAIGDDTLGNASPRDYTHGSSAQRIRWFRRGFSTGDPRQCDTFAIADHRQL
jgi:predicted metalloprotease